MKNKSIRSLVAAAILASASLSAPGVFAANPYGIVYSGGEPLSASNVQIKPNLVEELTSLIPSSGVNTTFSSSSKWKDGYYKSGENCFPIKYVDVSLNDAITPGDNVSLAFSKNQYTTVVSFKNITLDGVTDGSKRVPISIIPSQTSIYGGWTVYSDATCTDYSPGYGNLSAKNGERIFAEMNVKLYREGQETVFTTDDLYFGITDVDASQSFKILNTGNAFSPSNMFAKNAADLQTTDPNITLRNMYVANGNYLYTQYNPETGVGLDTPNNSNIYTKLTKQTQQDGLNIVFGFSGGAASAIEYYAKQYKVTYDSDKSGTISGITEEQIISGSYPSGSTTTPNDGYEFSYWIADSDITLNDGTVIKAGSPISLDQIKEVVVNQDIIFTAVHKSIEEPIAVPNTGESTKDVNAILASTSVIGVLLGALFIRALPRILHKKVDFEK